MAIQLRSSIFVHVGDWLNTELVESHGINVKTLAGKFSVSRQALSTLLNGHSALSADMAIRLEKVFGVKADTLLRMRTAYDPVQARAHEDEIHVERVLMPA